MLNMMMIPAKEDETAQSSPFKQMENVLDSVHYLTSMRPPKPVNSESRLGIKRTGDMAMGAMLFSACWIMRSVYAIFAVSIFQSMGTTNVPFGHIKPAGLLRKGVNALMFGTMESL
jgi:hypothetical protein